MDLEAILSEVRKRLFPTEEENRRALSVAERVRKIIEKEGIETVIVGSLARGTNLRGSFDVDLFLLFPRDIPFEELQERFFAIVEKLGIPYEIRYAQHPYVRLKLEVPVELVPAYKINTGEKPISAVDRSPLHQKYLEEKLDRKLREDARYLKAFMKGIGVYGAEVAVQGFSGYLCELLVLYYGGFINTLKAATRWRPQVYIHFGNGGKRFDEPLVVVDPVDPNRNVAAAVSLQSMATFVLASREFLRSPSLDFFFPPKQTLSKKDLEKAIKHRNTTMLLLYFKYPAGASPDNVWGELRRLERFLVRHLRLLGYNVRYSSSHTDEKDFCGVFIEIESYPQSFTEIRRGPSVFMQEHAERFLAKHRGDVYGPWIHGDRIYAEVFRESIAPELVLERLIEEAKQSSLGSHIKEALRDYVIYRNERMLEASPARDWLTRVLIRRPPWLPRE